MACIHTRLFTEKSEARIIETNAGFQGADRIFSWLSSCRVDHSLHAPSRIKGVCVVVKSSVSKGKFNIGYTTGRVWITGRCSGAVHGHENVESHFGATASPLTDIFGQIGGIL